MSSNLNIKKNASNIYQSFKKNIIKRNASLSPPPRQIVTKHNLHPYFKKVQKSLSKRNSIKKIKLKKGNTSKSKRSDKNKYYSTKENSNSNIKSINNEEQCFESNLNFTFDNLLTQYTHIPTSPINYTENDKKITKKIEQKTQLRSIYFKAHNIFEEYEKKLSIADKKVKKLIKEKKCLQDKLIKSQKRAL